MSILRTAGLVGVLLLAGGVGACGEDQRAVRDCQDRLASSYGYGQTYDVDWQDQGGNSFLVTGMIRIQHDRNRSFTCRIHHKDVVSLHVEGDSSSGGHHDGGHDSGKGDAVGAASDLGQAV